MQGRTLSEILINRIKLADRGVTIIEGNKQEEFLSYNDLYKAAIKELSYLKISGIRPHNELVLQINDYKTFIITFWACILGGIIPVPLSVGQNDEHKQKLFNIWGVLNKPKLFTSISNLEKLAVFANLRGFNEFFSNIKENVILADGIHSSLEDSIPFSANENDIAFIQFSSGSTGNPKGVILTHKNLVANLNAITKAARYTEKDSMISWMPLTHDMGLIGFHLNPLVEGLHQYLIPTHVFIRQPGLWLSKASEHKVTILSSPNFGYKYVLKNADRLQCEVDLSSVRILYNGAEPISEKVSSQFLQFFSIYGLKSDAMRPVYGLAEATLAVSFSEINHSVVSLSLERSSLNVGDKICIKTPSENTISFVNVGPAVDNCAVRLANSKDVALEEGIIGNVQIKGTGVTSGYYNNMPETDKVFTKDRWLRTGDLGFMHDGALYITGRAKDIIFVNGQNYYAHDLERIAEEVDHIELNKVAITGYFNNELGKDEIIAFVFHRGDRSTFLPIAWNLRECINRIAGVLIDKIIPVKEIPRTTSGKLQRFRLLELYLEGRFPHAEDVMNMLTDTQQAHAAIPVNNTEQTLLQIWKSILRNDFIKTDQSFFELGGNSLKAAEMGMLLSKEFQVNLPSDLLFENPTIQSLATELSKLDKQTYAPIPIARKSEFYPVSSAQKRLYYFWQMDKGSITYNIPLAFRVNGNLDDRKVEKSINKLVERHESLRLSFHMKEEPVFKINEAIRFNLSCECCDYQAVQQKLRSSVQPFELSEQPLFRIKLFKIQSDQYVLFFDFHHIISDGLSIYHFLDELLKLYADDELPPLPAQYKDYVFAEVDYLKSKEIEIQENYWMNSLRGELPVLEMPLDFQRPAVFSYEGEKIGFSLSQSVTRGLKDLAAANQCTLHVVMFTIYNILLSRYTAQRDVLIGIPVSGRRHADLLKAQGMFVNTLAIRSSIEGDEIFSELLQKEKKIISDALQNHDYPFDRIIKKLDRNRSASRNPVIDSMFNYQNMGMPDAVKSGLELIRHFFDPGVSKFDISMEVFDNGDTIEYYIEYATSLFKKSSIEGISKHFENLIVNVLQNPAAKINVLPIISDAEADLYINQFNNTGIEYPKNKTIHQLFDEQVKKTPEAIAVVHGREVMTYRQLDEHATRVAALLATKGVVPESVVGILLNRSPELIVVILGVLKAGGCFLPIDVALPEARIEYIVGDSRCQILIISDKYTDVFSRTDLSLLEVVNIDRVKTSSVPVLYPQNTSVYSNLAYIIYTSGTTGNPKGVMIEHRSLVNYITWASRQYIKEDRVTFPLFTSVSFDLTITSIFTPLLTGNTIAIYDDDLDGMAIQKIITEKKADIIKLTPSHLKIIANDSLNYRGEGNKVKRFIVGGEQLETTLSKAILNKFGGEVEIYNEYGPTEATIGCMVYQVNPQESQPNVPIGFPAANTRIYVLDECLQPVPPGVKGEIYISGDGVARGYIFKDKLTREKFIPDPFDKNKRMYKTGDFARRLPGGIIEFIGRTDQQIKINGYRIEPGEIENTLLGYNKVTGAVVTVKTNKYNKQELCAYYTSKTIIDENEIRIYLADRLPHYMIPSQFFPIEHIPLTKNGKTDYEGLAVSSAFGKSNETPLQAESFLERKMLIIWEEVLAERNISVKDNFFELGGDSIKAVQIASRLLEAGIELRAKDILTYHTIQQVSLRAEVISKKNYYEQGLATGEKALIPIEKWFFSHQFYNPGYYNQAVLLLCKRTLNVAALKNTFGKLVTHHDGLRINYDPVKGKLFYNNSFVGKEISIETIHLDADEDINAQIADVCKSIKSSMDITSNLLLKPAILRNQNGQEWLFITLHHLVIDGVSWRILLEDLFTLYNAFEKKEAATLRPKTASSANWANKLIEYSRSENFIISQAYWRAVECYQFHIPMDYETSDWRAKNARIVSRVLSREKTSFLLKEVHKTYRTDVPILLNTALALALKEWTGLSSFVIEQENHGRHLQSIDDSRTIGWFTTLYPLKLEIKDDNIGNQIKAIKEQIKKVPEFGLGYGIYRFGENGDNNCKSGCVDIRLNYLGRFDSELNNDLFAYADKWTESDIDPENSLTARLELNAMIMAGEFVIEFRFNAKAHKESTINRLSDGFLNSLDIIFQHIRGEKGLHFTPSDFTADLDQQELDALFC